MSVENPAVVGAWTPGPWGYGMASNYEGYYVSPANRLPTLAAVQGPISVHNFPGQTEANARLIAAAPELYDAAAEAFGALIYIFETSDDPQTSADAKEAADKLEPALRKARGES